MADISADPFFPPALNVLAAHDVFRAEDTKSVLRALAMPAIVASGCPSPITWITGVRTS